MPLAGCGVRALGPTARTGQLECPEAQRREGKTGHPKGSWLLWKSLIPCPFKTGKKVPRDVTDSAAEVQWLCGRLDWVRPGA